MKRFTMLLCLAALCTVATTAIAGPDAAQVRSLQRAALAAIVIPMDWDGVWTTLDSSYTCAGVFQSTSTSSDTICGGQAFAPDSPGMTFDCTGTADATTIDVTCTGSGPVFTDCTANFTMVSHVTRSGDTYHSVSTLSISYVGTGEGCDLLPSSCTQNDSWGTRTGPAPSEYCATPVRQPTWGQLKSRYR